MDEEEEGKVIKNWSAIRHGRATFGTGRANTLIFAAFFVLNVARPCHF